MFEGVSTALVTPFNDDGSIDSAALEELIEFQIKGEISGLVPMGTTGESPTVSHEENIQVIEIVCKKANGRVPVIAGTGSNATWEAIDMTKKAKDLGVSASLQVCPYYNKPNQEGLYRHFSEIADSVDLPLVIYNIPGRSGRNIENDTMLRLANHENIVAVKEASGSIPQVMDLIERKPDDFTVLSGDDNLAFPITALGGKGVISVASNIIPNRMGSMIQLTLDAKLEEARKLHYELLPVFRMVFLDTNPIPIKYAMSLKGMMKEVYRLPLWPLSEEKKSLVRKILSSQGIL